MAQEPITIFSQQNDPGVVLARLDELGVKYQLKGDRANWSEAVIKTGGMFKTKKVTITYGADYFQGEKGQTQRDGMVGYFSRFPDGPNRMRAMMLPSTLESTYGTIFEPDFDAEGDQRLGIVFEIARALEAVLFSPSGLRDFEGRILVSAYGPEEEDADAVWPKVAAQVQLSPEELAEAEACDEDEDHYEPTPERIARRALALTALTARAILEQEAGDDHAPDTLMRVTNWATEIGVLDEMEPEELETFHAPLGQFHPQQQANTTWRLEGLVVLAWMLKRFEIPPHDVLVDFNALWRSLGFLDVDEACALLENPEVRSRDEVETLRTQLLAVHWRLREFSLRGKAMNFAEFAPTAWFGPLDISKLSMVDGDMAIDGVRIDAVDRDRLSTVISTATERHIAVNWLSHGPETYSEASQAT